MIETGGPKLEPLPKSSQTTVTWPAAGPVPSARPWLIAIRGESFCWIGLPVKLPPALSTSGLAVLNVAPWSVEVISSTVRRV